jgi:hypothetical protein
MPNDVIRKFEFGDALYFCRFMVLIRLESVFAAKWPPCLTNCLTPDNKSPDPPDPHIALTELSTEARCFFAAS